MLEGKYDVHHFGSKKFSMKGSSPAVVVSCCDCTVPNLKMFTASKGRLHN